MNLTNAGKGSITLPLREGPDGAFFPARVRRDGTVAPAVPCIVEAGGRVEGVPHWYLESMLEEPGHRARIRHGELVVEGGDQPEQPEPEQPEPEQVSQPEPEQVSQPEPEQPEPEQVSQPAPEQVSQPARPRKRRG